MVKEFDRNIPKKSLQHIIHVKYFFPRRWDLDTSSLRWAIWDDIIIANHTTVSDLNFLPTTNEKGACRQHSSSRTGTFLPSSAMRYHFIIIMTSQLTVLGLCNWSTTSWSRTHNTRPKKELPYRRCEYIIPSRQFTGLTTETETSTIEKTFEDFTQRKDIAILLINQHVHISIINLLRETGSREDTVQGWQLHCCISHNSWNTKQGPSIW